MTRLFTAFVCGLIFAVGLGISGMTQPAKVTAFLDFTGNWDPSLAFVMFGGMTVYAVLYRVIRRLPSPLFAATFSMPTRKDIDLRLVGGAALFGIGWGLGGFCPGPALTSLAAGETSVLLFVTAMIGGMYLYKLWEDSRTRQITAPHQASSSV
jgi:uncharacterized membrane protein YedE/YeeE